MDTPANQQTVRKTGAEKFIRYLRPLLLILVVAALVYLAAHVGPGKIVETAKNLSPAWLLMSLPFIVANMLCATVRYRSLSAPELKFTHVLEVVMAGFLLNYAAMVQGLGIGAKVGLMKGRNVTATRSLAGVGGEVVLDLLFTGAVTVVFVAYVGVCRAGLDRVPPLTYALMGAVLLGGLVGIVVMGKYTKLGAEFREAAKQAFARDRLLINVVATVGVWIAGAGGFYCVLRAAGAVVPTTLALAALSVGFVTGLISLAPGGLGVRDVTWAYVCSTMAGVPLAVTTAAAFSFRILAIIAVALALGIWTLARMVRGNGK